MHLIVTDFELALRRVIENKPSVSVGTKRQSVVNMKSVSQIKKIKTNPKQKETRRKNPKKTQVIRKV